MSKRYFAFTWVLASKFQIGCLYLFSTAAGGESTQAPSIFKQAKDKVSVSTIIVFLVLHLKSALVLVAIF